MDGRLDPFLFEELRQRIAPPGPYHIQVKSMTGAGTDGGNDHLFDAAQHLVIAGGHGNPFFRPVEDMRQFGYEDSRLQAVHPAVDAFYAVLMLDQRTVTRIHAAFLRQRVVLGDDAAGVSISAQVLAGIETERPCDAEESGPAAIERGEMRLRAIFYQVDAMTVANSSDLVDGAHLYLQVNRDHGPGPGRDQAFQPFFIEAVVDRVGIGKHDARSCLCDRFRTGYPAVGHRDHFVSSAN